MDIDWQITFYNGASGTQIDQLTNNSPGGIASIDSFAINGQRDCLEASFTAKPSEMPDLVPGDQVLIEHTQNFFGLDYTYYVGFLATVGNPSSDDLQTYKAVGYKERLYDILVPDLTFTAEADAKVAAQELITAVSSRLPVRFQTTIQGSNAGQVVKPVVIGKKSVGEVLDELASLAGSFVVAPGDTFTYNSQTFDAGEIVPGVKWGVTATPFGPTVFFRRPIGSPLTLEEGEPYSRVTYPEVNDEEFINKVAVEYLSSFQAPSAFENISDEPDGGRFKTTSSILFFDFSGGDKRGRERVVTIDDPLPFLVDQASLNTTFGNVSNASNAFDGDDSSSAFLDGWNGTSQTLSGIRTDELSFSGLVGVIARVVFRLSSAGPDPNFDVVFFMGGDTFQFRTTTTDETIEALFYIPQIFETDESVDNTVTMQVLTLNDAQVYTMELFAPDLSTNDAFERFARSFTTTPRTQAAKFEYVTFGLADVAPEAVLTRLDGTEDTLSVERVNFRLTVDDGYVVEYDLGQGFEAEALSEKSVIQGIARAAARR